MCEQSSGKVSGALPGTAEKKKKTAFLLRVDRVPSLVLTETAALLVLGKHLETSKIKAL